VVEIDKVSGKLATLSSKPEGDLDDNLPPSKERIGTVKTPSGSLDILLERVEREKNQPIWLFSAETLKNVPEIYKELHDLHVRVKLLEERGKNNVYANIYGSVLPHGWTA
jgi:hypothetical protein